MEPENYKRKIAIEIYRLIGECARKGITTSKGERMSYAAIARAMDPPRSRVAVYRTAEGDLNSQLVREAIERELGRPFWVRRQQRAA